MIESYEFGSMRVKGQVHHHDLKIIGTRVIPNWWRRQGHVLHADDIADILETPVETLVVGTGASGAMRVSPEVTDAVSERGIELVSLSTGEAVTVFNRLYGEGRPVAGAFHLAC